MKNRLLETKSFEVAANGFGGEASEKIAILMPGRLDTKDYINFTSHGEVLARLGYYAIAIDPPGTWDSTGDLGDYSTSMYVQCVNELIDHFGNKPTLLLGHSRGGATAMIASANPHVSGLVVINAAYGSPGAPDMRKLVDGKLPESRDLPPGDTRTEEQIKYMLPMNYFKDGAKHNPAASLSNYNGPKLIVHATEDEFKPIDEVKEIFDGLQEPKMFLEVDCKHDYRLYPDVMLEINQALKRFLKK